ncbi:MAG: stearoyl-CoA 9-desaturase [Frankiales bacterium]|nr:stearoyl-CoA 9-desaturase [Frankiales bacterium]
MSRADVLPPRPPLRDRLLRVARAVSTPLLPDDYLALVDPLRGSVDLRARVEQVLPEAGGAVTLVLRPGPGWSGHRAGQWLRLGVSIDGVLQWRSYSLTTPPRPDGTVAVTVKPVVDGFVSVHLAREVRPGQVLRLAQAAGEFVLPDPLPERLLMVTAGSGLTPVMGMLRELADAGPLPDVVLLHSALTREDVLFGEELRALAAAHPRFTLLERHTDTGGLLHVDELDTLVPDWRDRAAWACGPAGLLDALEQHWSAAGLALSTERFAPVLAPVADGEGGTVSFARGGTVAEADGSTALLDAGEAAGVLLPSGCRMGICFGCVVPLLSGTVRDLRTGEVHGEPGDLVQTCVSAPAGDVTLDA